MKKLIPFFALVAMLFSCRKSANENAQANKVVIGTIDSIFSKTLNEQRKIWIYSPHDATKSPKAKYPVLLLLDGDAHFSSVVGMVQQLSTVNGNTICPEMVIVGIPNTDRFRDLTPTRAKNVFGDTVRVKASGGGENFTKFISDELIPYLDSHYPTTSYRTMIGHSLGGLMAINTLIHHSDLFSNYLAIDPSMWWDDRKLSKESAPILDEKKFDGKFLYVAVANTMRPAMKLSDLATDTTTDTEHIRSIFAFTELAKARAGGLKFESKYYGNDDHGSVPLIAEYDALRAMFSWYTSKAFDSYAPTSRATAAEIVKAVTDHYAKYGYGTAPPESIVNSLGYRFMNEKAGDKAFVFFELNTKNYPDSPNAFDSMGDYYLSQKDTAKAIASFERTLSLADVAYTKEKLARLRKK
jgi:predicted alpha/beta superfamily hydrolase